MKNRKKLLSTLLALAMSFYLLPTVWAEEDLQQLQDIPENPYAESVDTDLLPEGEDTDTAADTDLPQEEENADTDSTDADLPQTEENTDSNDEDYGIAPMSLLPIDTEYVDVLIDRTNGVPLELEDKPKYSFFVKEALHDFFVEKGIISDSEEYAETIMYSFNNSAYETVGWNDVITPQSTYYDTNPEYGYVRYAYAYFMVNGDQLDSENIRYCITVNFKYDEFFVGDLTLNLFNEDGKSLKIYDDYITNGIYYDKYKQVLGYNCAISYTEYGAESGAKDLYFLITLPEGYSKNNVEVYEGLIYNEAGLGSSENIAYKIINDGTDKEPYKMKIDGNLHWIKDLTFVITMEDGGKSYIPAHFYVYTNDFEVELIPSYSADSGYIYETFRASPDNEYALGYCRIYEANNFDNIKVSVSAYYRDYRDENSAGVLQRDVSKIKYAYFGKYSTLEEAVQAGEKDIKEKLFSYEGIAVDLSKIDDTTAYLDDGTKAKIKSIEIMIVDIYNVGHRMFLDIGVAEKLENAILSDDTYLNINGAKKVTDSGRKTYLSDYTVSSSNDSYFQNGYQTLFILDNENPVEDGTVIYPVFSNSSGVNVYAADSAGGNTPQTSEESPITFESGKAIQYSAASESGKALKNYWVTFITQQSGAKLFVNAVNNPDHYSANDKPQREIFLTPKNSYKHDIFFANIGDEELTGINVALSADAQGVKLDDYWTVINSSVKRLAAFTKTYNPDNIAKIRLVPVDEDSFGDISGTLSITTANGGSVDIELTGIAGIPKITTDKLYDGVKYVPYSSVIMTNSMYGGDSMSFSILRGNLPDGLVLRPNGEIYGIPTKVGAFTFTVKAVYNGATQEDGSEYSGTRTYTIVIADNTDENVDAVNSDEQGYPLTEKVSKYIKVYYNGMNGVNPIVDRIEIDNDLFWSEGSYTDEFMEFYIDGNKLMAGSDYFAEEGSTKITVRAQTFGHIGMTDSDVPHTLAAEFRTEGKTKDLKRSAQNVYLEYINTGKGDDVPDDIHGGNQGGNSSGNGNSGSANTNTNNTKTDAGSITAVMSIVDAEGNPISGLSVELHSSPKYAKTDSSGSVKFDSVEFGRHTLYIKDASSNKKVSQKFSIVSGSNTGIKGNVITASAGGTVSLAIEYDGSKIKILSAAEDVSSAAGINSDNEIALFSVSKSVFPKRMAVIIFMTVLAAAMIFKKANED